MGAVAQKIRLGADDEQDMVVITLGSLRPRIPYQSALELAHSLRVGSKSAARYDRQCASFWFDMDLPDLSDCPRTHRGFRRSVLASTVNKWQVFVRPPLVALVFNDVETELGYEDGIRVHHMIRRAARRAKAWAGDGGKGSRMLGAISDAEDDYRLGLM